MKIIVLGDYERAPYHPLTKVDELLVGMLQDEHEVTYTDDYSVLLLPNLSQYDLLIGYMDLFKELTYTDEQGAGLLQYVAGGGKVLYIHSGICMAQKTELAQMIGAKFSTHPKRCDIVYSGSSEHPITKGVASFTLFEEPYMVDFMYGTPCKTFLHFEYQGALYPAGWCTKYGLGHSVYLQPGHEASIFEVLEVQQLIKQAVAYLDTF
ncbi:MAG: ThuA domain-containing protein [Lachnospiraceae bacterium]